MRYIIIIASCSSSNQIECILFLFFYNFYNWDTIPKEELFIARPQIPGMMKSCLEKEVEEV